MIWQIFCIKFFHTVLKDCLNEYLSAYLFLLNVYSHDYENLLNLLFHPPSIIYVRKLFSTDLGINLS